MKISISLRTDFIHEDGTCALYLRVFTASIYAYYSLGIDVKPEFWDKDKEEITGGADKKQNNLLIKEVLGRAADILLKYKVNKLILTHERFKHEFESKESTDDFIAFMREEIDKRYNLGDIKFQTYKLEKSVLKKLSKYKRVIPMCDVTKDFLEAYRIYLKKGSSGAKNCENTLNTNFRRIKTYVYIAIKKGLITLNPFEFIKIKKVATYPMFLTIEEVKKLIILYNSNRILNSHRSVLRQFLFACQTGMRLADLKSFTQEDVNGNELIYKPKKNETNTKVTITVPLTKLALQLIEDETAGVGSFSPVFAKYTPERMRKYLKEVVKVVGITKDISIHTARHTFATNFLKCCKVANGIIILQKLLGHADIETTMIYSHIINKDAKNAMAEFELMIND